jgi:hypothetical protein
MPECFETIRGAIRLAVFAVCLGVAGKGTAQKVPGDWEKLCRISTAVEQELADVKDPSERASRWAAAVLAGQPWGKGFTNSFRAMAAVEPSMKFRFLQTGAEEEGVPGWSCPAVKRLLNPFDGVIREHPCSEEPSGARRASLQVKLVPPMAMVDVRGIDSGADWQGQLGYSTTPAGDRVFSEKAQHASAVFCLDIQPGAYLLAYFSDATPPDQHEQKLTLAPGQSLRFEAKSPSAKKRRTEQP